MVEAPARARIWLLIALAVPAAWFVALSLFKSNVPIADERLHLAAIHDFADGKQPPAGLLAMPPGFHWLASWPARLFGPTLTAARAVSLAFTLAALILLHGTALRSGEESHSTTALRFALLPIGLPFSSLVYTEAAALFGLSLTLWLFFRGRRSAAYAIAAASCAVRQSAIAWIVLLAVLEIMEWRDRRRSADLSPPPPGENHAATGLLAILLRAGVAVLIVIVGLSMTGGLSRGPATENKLAFNRAQFYLFAIVAVVCFAPVWIAGLWSARRFIRRRVLPRPLLLGAAAACVGVFALEFDNPHPWNVDPNYFRNRLLIALHGSLGLRLAFGALAVVAAAGFWSMLPPWPRRGPVLAVGAIGGLYLSAHWLADPRYCLPIVLLYTLLQPLPQRLASAQAAWLAGLSVAASVLVLRYGGPAGGIF